LANNNNNNNNNNNIDPSRLTAQAESNVCTYLGAGDYGVGRTVASRINTSVHLNAP